MLSKCLEKCARRSTRVAGAGALAAALLAGDARADDDPWFGRDKALHFGASAALGAGGYGVGRALLERRSEAVVFGSVASLAIGAAKEGADALGLGTPSWRDLTWDVIGTAVGVLLAWGTDLAIFGTTSAGAPVGGPAR